MFRSVFHYGLVVLSASTLGAQQPDTVADSVFLAQTRSGWPERSPAFGEWHLWRSPSLHAGAPRCRYVAPVITRDSIGPVRPGMTLAELQRACPRILHAWFEYAERYTPVVAVGLGEAIVVAFVEDTARASKLSDVSTRDSAARTPEGLGVGSSYARLRARYGPGSLNGSGYECAITVATFRTLPGVHFHLPYQSPDCEDPTEGQVRATRVSEVLVRPPSPAEVAARQPSPLAASDSMFAAATSMTWPRPSPAYTVERVPRDVVPVCVTSTPVITPDSIGPIAIGEPLDQLRQRCPRLLYVWELKPPGRPAVFVRLGGVIVWAFVADTMPASHVNFIQTVDSAARTAEGIGVGVEVTELFIRHKDVVLMSGPEPAREYCQLSFQSLRGLSFSLPLEACERRTKRTGRIPLSELLPPGTRITGVQVRGVR
jgi:hypothetical protein